jgi:dolichyl-phosphate beta-glucosyltransferase
MGSLQGMLCSRGQLLLMLDSDGATKITDLEKLESQVRVLDVLAQNLLYSFKSI